MKLTWEKAQESRATLPRQADRLVEKNLSDGFVRAQAGREHAVRAGRGLPARVPRRAVRESLPSVIEWVADKLHAQSRRAA